MFLAEYENPMTIAVLLSQSKIQSEFSLQDIFGETFFKAVSSRKNVKFILGRVKKALEDNFSTLKVPSYIELIEVEDEKDFLKRLALPYGSFSPEQFFQKSFKAWEEGKLTEENLKKHQEELRRQLPLIVYYKELPLFFFEELLPELLNSHINFIADVSFYDNAPAGVSPLLIAPWFLNTHFSADTSFLGKFSEREDFKSLCLKNLNQVEAELDYLTPDISALRTDFTYAGENPQDLKRLLVKDVRKEDYKSIAEKLLFSGNVLRIYPHYFEIEITDSCQLSCSYCPRQFSSDRRGEMSLDFFSSLLNQIEEFPTANKTLCLGGLGEPLEHSRFLEFISQIANKQREESFLFENIYLETNAQNLNKELSREIIRELGEKVVFIINLSFLREAEYKKMQGGELALLLSNLKDLKSNVQEAGLSVLKQIVIQVLKIKETENEIDTIVNHFKQEGLGVLIQKYNSYAGLMPERRVSDLTPLNRSFCWHLARDVFIRSDGKLAFCKQDIEAEKALDLTNTTLQEAWLMREDDFIKNYKEDYSSFSKCKNCDEWFTYNA